jgi:sulfopyruvate decarboxylase TPP-binding subunit
MLFVLNKKSSRRNDGLGIIKAIYLAYGPPTLKMYCSGPGFNVDALKLVELFIPG